MATQTPKEEKVEEILKPHYAQIQDRSARLAAVRACHSDRERSALAEGWRSQANIWATEALHAVLECKDIIPRELASGSDLISEIIIRLAQDAAEFYSILTEDTTTLRKELQESLKKFAEGSWDENERRHLLLVPLPPGVVTADEPLIASRRPRKRVRVSLPVSEAKFKTKDYKGLTEAIRQTGWTTVSDSPATVPSEGVAKAAKGSLQELPTKFQNAFIAAKAKAELEYANRAEHFTHQRFFGSGLERPLLIQTVFLAYCDEARSACRQGEWTVARASQSADAAWPIIFESYFVREHAACPEAEKLEFCSNLWRTITDNPRWKQHLAEIEALAGPATEAAAFDQNQRTPASAGSLLIAEPGELAREQRRSERAQRLNAAQERWRPSVNRLVPFAWIHKAAKVDHKDAYDWKSGKLPDTSAMSKSIERALQQSNPPAAPVTD